VSCADCAAGEDHCHEVWVVHDDGTQECLHLDCRVEVAGHGWRVVCTEVHDCGCAA
jgi:hypothetical protein